MVKNLSANAGDTGPTPDLGRSHMPQPLRLCSRAREPKLQEKALQWKPTHCKYIPHFVYLFICQWISGLLPHFDFWRILLRTLVWFNICLSPCFQFSWDIYWEVKLLDHVVMLCLIFFEESPNLFLPVRWLFLLSYSMFRKILLSFDFWISFLFFIQVQNP